jgi:hypothetical protein
MFSIVCLLAVFSLFPSEGSGETLRKSSPVLTAASPGSYDALLQVAGQYGFSQQLVYNLSRIDIAALTSNLITSIDLNSLSSMNQMEEAQIATEVETCIRTLNSPDLRSEFCWKHTTSQYGFANQCEDGYSPSWGECWQDPQPDYTCNNLDQFCYHSCPPGYSSSGVATCHLVDPTPRGSCPTSTYPTRYGLGALGDLCYHSDVGPINKFSDLFAPADCPTGYTVKKGGICFHDDVDVNGGFVHFWKWFSWTSGGGECPSGAFLLI